MTRREWVAPQWRERLQRYGLRPAALLEASPDQLQLGGCWKALVKPGLGGRERWCWSIEDEAERLRLFVKRYVHTPPRAQWDRIVRQSSRCSRGWWEKQQCLALTGAAVPTPQPVAAAEEMRGWWERRSVLILAEAPGEALDRQWRAACAEAAAITRGLARHDLTLRLARLVSAFHQSGHCHRDLYLCHIFAKLDFDGRRAPEFCIIDLARAIRPRARRMRWLIKDLAQLDSSARQVGASRADRLRFLQAYLGLQRGSARIPWYARRVQRKSDGILRRIARKERAR